MMIPLSNEFTPEELDLIKGAVSPIPHPAYRELLVKVERLRLIGKKVRFLDIDDNEQVGELRGYLDWEDLMMAEIVCKGFIHRVGLSKVLGEA